MHVLFTQLLKSFEDVGGGVNILVVRLIENGGMQKNDVCVYENELLHACACNISQDQGLDICN